MEDTGAWAVLSTVDRPLADDMWVHSPQVPSCPIALSIFNY